MSDIQIAKSRGPLPSIVAVHSLILNSRFGPRTLTQLQPEGRWGFSARRASVVKAAFDEPGQAARLRRDAMSLAQRYFPSPLGFFPAKCDCRSARLFDDTLAISTTAVAATATSAFGSTSETGISSSALGFSRNFLVFSSGRASDGL